MARVYRFAGEAAVSEPSLLLSSLQVLESRVHFTRGRAACTRVRIADGWLSLTARSLADPASTSKTAAAIAYSTAHAFHLDRDGQQLLEQIEAEQAEQEMRSEATSLQATIAELQRCHRIRQRFRAI
eukprot:SAG31_NODE_995_length_10494_cov_8.173641_8_plen_127_part_00